MIVILDYQMGNVGSIRNMLQRVGVEATISAQSEVIAQARAIILPGVGAFDAGMMHLQASGLRGLLDELVLERRRPVLGICLGMQLLCRRSEEGRLPGLGWLDADVVRFQFPQEESPLRIPHMGWNSVEVRRADSLFQDHPERPRYYFVHSYHVVCDRQEDILAETCYGRRFASSVQKSHIFGTQFHPEKSHRFGMHLLTNFAKQAA